MNLEGDAAEVVAFPAKSVSSVELEPVGSKERSKPGYLMVVQKKKNSAMT